MNQKSITDFPNAPDIESSTWDYASRFSGPVGEWMLQQQIDATRDFIKQRWPDQTGLSILDVGGGHGQNIALVNALGHRLTILGSNESCNQVIKEKLDSGLAEFNVGTLLALPYDDKSFDVVICYRILSHMDSWQALIGELTRVARHLVLVDYPSKRSFNIISDLLFLFKKQIEKNTRRYGYFPDDKIDAVFVENGFNRTHRRRQFFLPMAIYRLIGNLRFSKLAAGFFRKVGLTAMFGSPVISAYQPK